MYFINQTYLWDLCIYVSIKLFCCKHFVSSCIPYRFACQCHLLISFANSLALDQAGRIDGPDLGRNYLPVMVFLKDFSEKINFQKKSADNKKKQAKLPPACKKFMSEIDLNIAKITIKSKQSGIDLGKSL